MAVTVDVAGGWRTVVVTTVVVVEVEVTVETGRVVVVVDLGQSVRVTVLVAIDSINLTQLTLVG